MNIEEFFELSAGKWFAHRTHKDLVGKISGEGKSELILESLPLDSPEVAKICQHYQIDAKQAACAAKFNWNDITKLNQKDTGSTVVVLIPNIDNPLEGKFLHQISEPINFQSLPGRYKIGEDESLTLCVEVGDTYSEERLWFASPNLRMRVSISKRNNGFSTTSFTSEIRMGAAPPSTKTSQATQSR
ncbi:MAG: phycobiliprotein lyase [Richelia sp.]|nr:phycobiliprotein lyase [Richelia sp.]CDN16529.1 Phycoerythrin linker protein CpeS homolog [Richelia intracellularis]